MPSAAQTASCVAAWLKMHRLQRPVNVACVEAAHYNRDQVGRCHSVLPGRQEASCSGAFAMRARTGRHQGTQRGVAPMGEYDAGAQDTPAEDTQTASLCARPSAGGRLQVGFSTSPAKDPRTVASPFAA